MNLWHKTRQKDNILTNKQENDEDEFLALLSLLMYQVYWSLLVGLSDFVDMPMWTGRDMALSMGWAWVGHLSQIIDIGNKLLTLHQSNSNSNVKHVDKLLIYKARSLEDLSLYYPIYLKLIYLICMIKWIQFIITISEDVQDNYWVLTFSSC